MTQVFREGQTVRVRGTRSIVSRVHASSVDPEVARLDLRVITGERPNSTFCVVVPIDIVEVEEPAPLGLERLATFRSWQRFHDAYRFELALAPTALQAMPQARIAIEAYQRLPAQRALALPRPRLLIADDVGLGKTIEAGLVYLELAARRRAQRVIIVAPASICAQWQRELLQKFGIAFDVFSRDEIERVRRGSEIGANPFTLRPRVIISQDLAKMESTFAELRRSEWDLAIIDEAHHATTGENENLTLNRRFAQWLASATRGLLLLSATPHDGTDATFASLLALLEPRIVPSGTALQRAAIDPYVVRRLKRHVKRPDGSAIFVPRAPVQAIPVTQSEPERALHHAVLETVRTLREQAAAAKGDERVRTEFLSTIVRKRLASSRAALTRTIENRRATVDRTVGSLQARSDLLRRARAGEPLSEEEEAQLEVDLHAASIVASQQRVGRRRRQSEDERDLFTELSTTIAALEGVPETKLAVLEAHLRAVWQAEPAENVLIFSEYRDTAESVVVALRRALHDNVLLLHGETDVADREMILARFERESGLALVATDVASEGLNLQARCRTLVHYDLPWNPNRLEQRNGRIDRYGQTREPHIAYLYAENTYDGELLNILVRKVERQIAALGSVGDVLGALQPKRIDELLRTAEDTMTPGLRAEAESRIDDALGEAKAPRALAEIATRSERAVLEERPPLGPFVAGAIVQCGGHAAVHGAELVIDALPSGWHLGPVPARHALPDGPVELPLLTELAPVVRAAINAVRELRYDRRQDPRVAAAVRTAATGPTIVATFLVSMRAGDGETIERLETLAVDAAGTSLDPAPLYGPSDAKEPSDLAVRVSEAFWSWWQRAHAAASDLAHARAAEWHAVLLRERAQRTNAAQRQLGDWYAAEARAIREQGGLAGLAGALFAGEESPQAQRELARAEAEHHRQREALSRYGDLRAPAVEPLGLLLVLPP